MKKKTIEKLKKVLENKENVIDYLRTECIIDPTIRDFIKKKKHIIHGAKAMNAQARFPYQRYSRDYDVFSKNPKLNAEQLDKLLDKVRNGNYHYVKKATHPGTYKVMDVGFDLKRNTKDDFNLVDYTRKPSKIKTIKIGSLIYVALSEIEKSKKRALAQKQYEYRWKKDKEDILRIKAVKKQRKKQLKFSIGGFW